MRISALATACTLFVTLTACALVRPDAGQTPLSSSSPGSPAVPSSGLADVVQRVTPSVVTVNTTSGLGSGVVYKPDVILTNQHVVQGVTDVMIDFADGTSSPGKVLAADRATDLAVVRTGRANLPVPEYRAELPRPGDTVLAIGSPLGFEGTVTAGIVSALNRQIPGSAAESRALVDLIQVDAAISPGNSGGALLDGNGRVIGINEAYIPPAAGAVSLGFAIPAATVVDVADQLLAKGTATHSFLGVVTSQLTPEISQQMGVSTTAGAVVLRLEPASPAAAAGVMPGDILVRLGTRQIGSVEDLFGALRDTQPGQQVPLELIRGGATQQLTVTIGAMSG